MPKESSNVKCYVKKAIFVKGEFKKVGTEITLSDAEYRELAQVDKVGKEKPAGKSAKTEE